MRRNLGLSVDDPARAFALKKIAAGVQVYLAVEHDEHYDLTTIERAVGEWFVGEVESLLADGVELLTAPRHGSAYRIRERLCELRAHGRALAHQGILRRAA